MAREIQIEEFKEICIEMIPLIEQMQEAMKSHSIDEIVSLAVAADGYMSFAVDGCHLYLTHSKKGNYEINFEKWEV